MSLRFARRAAPLPALLMASLLSAPLPACDGESGVVNDFGGLGALQIPRRPGAVVVLGCSLSSAERSSLASASAKKSAQEVVFACFDVDAQGELVPSSTDGRKSFAADAAWVAQEGYAAKAGVALAPQSVTDVPRWLDMPGAMRSVASSIAALAVGPEGVELDLRPLPSAASGDVTELVKSVRKAFPRDRGTLGLWVQPARPPSADDASDLIALGPLVDRMRVMTLDGSPGPASGPSIDTGLAVDDMRIALDQLGSTQAFVTVPLQGSAQATVLTLAAWPTTVLPGAVGVLFYDLGAEDPAVWNAIEEATP